MKDLFLRAPDSELDASVKPLIEKWDEPQPRSIQVLEVLDHCIFAGLASGFAVHALQTMYAGLLEKEGRTHEDNVPLATWRTV